MLSQGIEGACGWFEQHSQNWVGQKAVPPMYAGVVTSGGPSVPLLGALRPSSLGVCVILAIYWLFLRLSLFRLWGTCVGVSCAAGALGLYARWKLLCGVLHMCKSVLLLFATCASCWLLGDGAGNVHTCGTFHDVRSSVCCQVAVPDLAVIECTAVALDGSCVSHKLGSFCCLDMGISDTVRSEFVT